MGPTLMDPIPINLSPTYGVLLIGVLVAAFFQGILTVQVYQYYQDFPDDPRKTKIFVAVLWILDFVHLVLISYTIYYYLVISWGNISDIMSLIPPFSAHLLVIAFTSLFSQLFFLYRIWFFSQKNVWVVGPVFICSLANFSLIFTMGILSITVKGFPQGLVPMVIMGTVTDVLIAGLICYYVRKRSEDTRNMRVTSTLVTQVIRYTVATSALTSLLILACLFAFLASPFTFTYIALHFSSGRTYANAVLVNLNARRKFRETLGSIEPSFAKSVDFGGSSGGTRRIPRFNASTQDDQSCRTHVTRSVIDGNRLGQHVRIPLKTYPPRSRYSLP